MGVKHTTICHDIKSGENSPHKSKESTTVKEEKEINGENSPPPSPVFTQTGEQAANYVADIRARRKEQQKMTAYRLYRLGWTGNEIEEITGIGKNNFTRDFLSQFPELENDVKKLLNNGLPHLDIAERFNMPLILVWAIDLSGRTDQQKMERLKDLFIFCRYVLDNSFLY